MARWFHWISLPLHRLPLHWTCCNRNRCTTTVRRPVRVILGPRRGTDLLERDWHSQRNAVPDMIAWGQERGPAPSLFSYPFPDHYEVGLRFVSDGAEERR